MPKPKKEKSYPLNLKKPDPPTRADFIEAEHREEVELLHHTIRHLLADLDLHEALNAAYRLRIDRIRNEVHEDRVANAILRPRMFIRRPIK